MNPDMTQTVILLDISVLHTKHIYKEVRVFNFNEMNKPWLPNKFSYLLFNLIHTVCNGFFTCFFL
jgi:hypothetical protein